MSIEQQGNPLTFVAFFTEARTGRTGLTVTTDVFRNGTQIITAASATAIGGGAYSYTLASGDVTAEGLYLAVFKTATATVDQQHIPSLWTVGTAGIENLNAAVNTRLATAGYTAPTTAPTVAAIRVEMDLNSTRLANLDVTVGSRLASTAYTAPTTPPTSAAIAGTVWDRQLSLHTTAGSAGAAVAALAADNLHNPVPGPYAVGTAGHALGRVGVTRVNTSSVSAVGMILNAAIVAGDTVPILLQITDTRVTTLDGATIRYQFGVSSTMPPLVSKVAPVGIAVVSSPGTTIRITLLPVDTQTLHGNYYHEVEVTTASGVVATVAKGTLTIDRGLIAAP